MTAFRSTVDEDKSGAMLEDSVASVDAVMTTTAVPFLLVNYSYDVLNRAVVVASRQANDRQHIYQTDSIGEDC